MNVNERLKSLRKAKKISQEEAAQQLGVSLSSYQKYEREKNCTIPSLEVLLKIADFYNVTTDYLLGRNTEELSTFDKLAGEFNMSALEKKIMEGYVNLPQNMRTDLMDFLHRSVLEVMDESRVEYISVSFADYPVSAGLGDELVDYEQWEKRSIVKTEKTRKANFIIRVDGDSMEPLYHDGDYIAVKQQDTVDIGRIGVFALDGKGYIKKFGGDCLISLNEEYAPIPLTENSELHCFGLVLEIAKFEG